MWELRKGEMTFLCDMNVVTNELAALIQAQGQVWFLLTEKRKRSIQKSKALFWVQCNHADS